MHGKHGFGNSLQCSFFKRSVLFLLVTVLFLFLSTSCSDESNPVISEEGGSECVHYENYMRYVGHCLTPGWARGVAVSGGYACIADDEEGLQVIDVSMPDAPEIVGTVSIPGDAQDVIISGNYAYVTTGSDNIQVVDISAPETPAIVGSLDTPGSAEGMDVSGSYMYVADGDEGLKIVDITNLN